MVTPCPEKTAGKVSPLNGTMVGLLPAACCFRSHGTQPVGLDSLLPAACCLLPAAFDQFGCAIGLLPGELGLAAAEVASGGG